MSYSLEAVRQDLGSTRIIDLPEPTINEGQAVIRVDKFGFTANNITYGVVGDAIGYWKFFPAEGEWGRIPVWGIGTVIDVRRQPLWNHLVPLVPRHRTSDRSSCD